MKKLLSLGLIMVAFFMMSTKAQAQTEAQQKVWDQAKYQTEKLSEKISLDDNQTAYMIRHLYNYQDRLAALSQHIENFPFSSKAEVDARLNQEVEMVLNADQFEVFKQMKSELLKAKPAE